LSENPQAAAAVDESDLFAYLETLWRYRRALLLLFLASVATAAALSLWVIPPKYEAVSLVQVGLELSLGSPDVYRNFLKSELVVAETARATGVKVRRLRETLKVEVAPNTNLVKLVVEANSPARAEAIGEAWQGVFRRALQSIYADRLEQQLAAQRARLAGMQQSWESLAETAGGRPELTEVSRQILVAGDVVAMTGEVARLEQVQAQLSRGVLLDATVIAPFQAKKEPVAPRKALNVAIAGFLALMMGGFGVFVAEAWRTRTSPAG
jgi:uncharacterized protein involved in exopolysaccharide biosynthesis